MSSTPSAAELLYGSADYGRPKQSAPPPAAARSAGPSVLSAAQSLYGGSHPLQPAASAAPAPVQAAPAAPHAQVPEPEPKPAPRPEDEGRQTAADLFFGDTPDDGAEYVNYGEMALDSVAAVALDLPAEMAAAAQAGEMDQAREAFVAAGIGHTLAGALVEQAKEAFRAGPVPADRLAAMETETRAALQKRFGKNTEAKIAAAQSIVAEAAVKWPGIKDWLEQSGMGNCPKLIQRLAARAERRPGKR
jgi:hypothetical protein